MDEPKVIVKSFKGYIRPESMNLLLSELKSELLSFSTDIHLNKRIFQAVAETLENVSNYVFNDESRFLEFELSKQEPNSYFYRIKNMTHHDHRPELESKLKEIFESDEAVLRSKIQTALRSSYDSDMNSAGLGLLLLAKKHQGQIKYNFEDHNENWSFFNISITFNSPL